MSEPILCYISGNMAFFTTQKLEDVRGDDLDDAPYEHNAGDPYEPCWHNEPQHRNDPDAKRGYRPGTQDRYDVGEMCVCPSCLRDWNEDGTPTYEISKLAFESYLEPPSNFGVPCSVRDINAGFMPWLQGRIDGKRIFIPAGTTKSRFIELIRETGGTVYAPIP